MIGPMIVLISLAHIPSVWLALNYFDPPKRFLWAVLAAVLALSGTVRVNRLGRGALWLSWGLVAWMGFRTLVRPVPTAELDVLFTWMLPLILLMLVGSALLVRRMRLLEMGDDTACALGVQVERSRLLLMLVAVVLTAASTALAGPISFIALVAPHIARRLSGTDIPISARCLAIADAYDAMTSSRPYREAMPAEVAMNEILENADKQFDPDLADLFVKMCAWEICRSK